MNTDNKYVVGFFILFFSSTVFKIQDIVMLNPRPASHLGYGFELNIS